MVVAQKKEVPVYALRGTEVFDRKTGEMIFAFTRFPRNPVIPSCISIEENVKIDKRAALAKAFYELPLNQSYLIYKTTRAGVTTSLVAESLNRREAITLIAPTKRIGREIANNIETYTENKNARIIVTRSSKECPINQEKIRKFPDLDELSTIPLPENCTECKEYNICPNTLLARVDKVDLIVMTHDKGSATILSEFTSELSAIMLEKINQSKNILFDECHKLEFENKATVQIKRLYNNEFVNTDFSKYENVGQHKSIKKVIDKFNSIISHPLVLDAIKKVESDSQTKSIFTKHLSVPVIFHDLTGSLKETNKMLKVGVFEELVDLMIERESHNLDVRDVKLIESILSIAVANTVSINAIKSNDNTVINISAIDSIKTDSLRSFIMSMQSGKRVILTSATIGSFDYGKMFINGIKPHQLIWGKGGDPYNTNSKMLILADKFNLSHIGRNSFDKRKSEIVDRILEIRNKFPDTKIIAMSKTEAIAIRKELEIRGKYLTDEEIDYYNSDKAIGVESRRRTLIIVNLAYKPTNTYDPVTDSVDESFKMWTECVHADSWQAISRVKDPDGIFPSCVFAIGVNFDDCVDIATWGKNRSIEIKTEGKKKEVVTFNSKESERITFPKIKPCNNISDMLAEANHHINRKSVF